MRYSKARPATRVIIERLQFMWKTQKDQWSEITQIMVGQMNQWILVQSGFIGLFD